MKEIVDVVNVVNLYWAAKLQIISEIKWIIP